MDRQPLSRDAATSAAPRFTFPAAIAMGAFAFAFRLLTLSSLPNDQYLYLVWAQQLLLGEMPGRDFVEPGMPLQIAMSAAAQAIAPGPATEGLVTIAMLAVAAIATCIGVAWLTRSVSAGVLAAAFQILIQPRLYSFPKILVPAVLLVLALVYARRPAVRPLLAIAVWIAIAFLFRHDLGGYAAIGGAAIVALSHRTAGRATVECARLTASVLVILLPYFAFLEWSGGLVDHLRNALEYGKSEIHLFEYEWPVFGFGVSDDGNPTRWDQDDAAAFLFYCAYALPVAAVLLLLRGEHRGNVVVRAAVVGMAVVAAFYVAVILRYPLAARIPDLAAQFAILGGWCAVSLVRLSRGPGGTRTAWRTATQVTFAAVVALALYSTDVLVNVRGQLRDAELLDSPDGLTERAREIVDAGRVWPWPQFWPAGPVPAAIEYVNACTGAADRILVTWSAPEYYFFARRGFAAGHAMFLAPRAYTSPEDQQLMVARLTRNRPPLVLINESSRAEFAAAYPQVDEYLRRQYTSAGQFDIRDGSTVTIGIRRELKATGVHGEERWPCGFVPDRPGTESPQSSWVSP
jgi:hypothetical protein